LMCHRLTMMKTALLFLLLVFTTTVANAWPNNAGEKKIVCRIGDSGVYIGENEECIDTRDKCEAKSGFWYGSVMGRGRTVGCSLPTKDAGRTCSDSSQCESICVVVQSNKPCSCHGRTMLPKGPQPDMCTFNGIQPGALDD
jgi:hypothetical protein